MNNTIELLSDDFKILYENCVICESKTDIPIDRHIDFRSNYVEGAGQLCNKCSDKIFEKYYE